MHPAVRRNLDIVFLKLGRHHIDRDIDPSLVSSFDEGLKFCSLRLVIDVGSSADLRSSSDYITFVSEVIFRVARAVYEETKKSERVQRHEDAPRQTLPEAVSEALEFDEPETEAAGAP
jgi:hypothetical protein